MVAIVMTLVVLMGTMMNDDTEKTIHVLYLLLRLHVIPWRGYEECIHFMVNKAIMKRKVEARYGKPSQKK